jgi:hypothetical protein
VELALQQLLQEPRELVDEAAEVALAVAEAVRARPLVEQVVRDLQAGMVRVA